VQVIPQGGGVADQRPLPLPAVLARVSSMGAAMQAELKQARAVRIREKDIQRTVNDLLALDGWRHLRCDPMSDPVRKRYVGEVGMADELYIRYNDARCLRHEYGVGYSEFDDCTCTRADVLWIEFKRPGYKARTHQLRWHHEERLKGAVVWLFGKDFPATVDGFLEHYRKSGLMRREI